jgi:rubrerythrin
VSLIAKLIKNMEKTHRYTVSSESGSLLNIDFEKMSREVARRARSGDCKIIVFERDAGGRDAHVPPGFWRCEVCGCVWYDGQQCYVCPVEE